MLGFRAPFSSRPLLLVINPLRSEQEAFRFFVYVLVVVAVAVGIVFFVRAIT
jgi:hypothetical protein